MGRWWRSSPAAADILAKEGVDAEVLDLRSLQPWDEAAVLESLARTHRLVVCHEAVEAFGVGAEIVARLADIGFDELDGPAGARRRAVHAAAIFGEIAGRLVPAGCRPDRRRGQACDRLDQITACALRACKPKLM